MSIELITALCLGIGLSASCGFRVFVPLLAASVAGHYNLLPFIGSFDGHFEWLSSWAAIITFATASVVEIMAYYIPVVDNLLDSIASPLAVVAGALLTTSVIPIDNEAYRWLLGLIVGGGSAGIIQSGTVLTRLFSSKATLATANPVVSTSENVAAVGGSVLSFFIPIIVGVFFVIVFVFLGFKFIGSRKK
ncbi:MAG: DUF4126 domain-containing protein [Capnocytophaga sp.]|nr:DUF4126 domain-containing protein [Capnocytophaga sp.]